MATTNFDILSALVGMGGGNSTATPADVLGAINPQVATGGGLFDGLSSLLGDTSFLNDLGQGVGALGGLFNIYSGARNLGQARDAFNFQKGLASTELANTANLTNERLATRQATRLRNPNRAGGALSEDQVAQGVADFMAKYGVSGKIGG